MKRKILFVLLVIVFAVSITLAACNNSNSEAFEFDDYTPSAGGSNEIVLPTEIPAATEPSVQIHYHRNNSNDYKTWGFWIWADGKDGAVYTMQYQDDNGGVAVYPLSAFGDKALTGGIGFIPRLQSSWTKDCDDDRLVNFAEYTLKDNYYHVYITQGDKNVYKDVETMRFSANAAFVSETQISVKTKEPIKHIKVFEGSELLAETKTEKTVSVRYNLPKDKQPDLTKGYSVEVQFADSSASVKQEVAVFALYGTESFNETYYYDGELGALYEAGKTTFKVWSPVSSKIVLNLYNSGHQKETPVTQEMTKGSKGVFETTVAEDLAGKYYTYTVYNSVYPNGKEIVDPYAKSAGLSGARGQIVDFSKTNPTGWNDVSPKAYDRKELVVWETHVADVTSSATWTGTESLRKTFLGMIEQGTTYTKTKANGEVVTVKTGFDHIRELGVNAVQLLPIFDQSNDESNMKFNWGYNPLNYNVLEGGYSTDAADGYVRIKEFKQLIQAFNGSNINIIMDVVYNHVSAATGSNFDVLMPNYYFRYNADGSAANGSGCGNETASDHKMFQKFMVDSLCFWAKEYKLGGFRFDLMGVHDIDTMNLIAAELKKINPDIVIYGEPWEGGTSALPADKQADQANANKLNGVGQFNDQMRDALIKGGMNSDSSTGWVTNMSTVNAGDVTKIVSGLKGITDCGTNKISDPNRTVNYVTCHDNYTLYDRIVASGVRTTNWQLIRNMAVLANSMVLTSNGTSFILAGEEFLRTKGGDHNSYESSYKVNELNYDLKANNLQVFEVYQKLVEFKTTCKGLHLEESQIADNYQVTTLSDGAVIQITVKDSKTNRTYKIIHANGTISKKTVTSDFSGYTLYLDTLSTDVEMSVTTAIKPYQTIIAYKG